MELEAGTLGGMYTTVEGLLTQIIDGMNDSHPIFLGDSAESEKKKQYDEFMNQLKAMRDGKRGFTIDIVDPLANSWVYSDYAPNPDPRLEIVDYQRTWEENEQLGINDIVVDDDAIDKKNIEEHKSKMEEAAKKVVEEEKEERELKEEEQKKFDAAVENAIEKEQKSE